MSSMAQQFLDMTRAMANIDVSTLPVPFFMGALRKALIARGFPTDDAEIITARMKLTLAAGALTSEQLEEIAGHYATLLSKMREDLAQRGFENPLRALHEMAAEMSLKAEF